MHPVIQEIARVHRLGDVQNHAFRRWQRILKDEVQRHLDERDALLVEVAELLEENAALKAENEKLRAPIGPIDEQAFSSLLANQTIGEVVVDIQPRQRKVRS
jgi:regulator of replication initiation timing